MEKTIMQKSKFALINDKRFFSDGIVSLPFSHLSMKTLIDYKNEIGKEKLLKMEHAALLQN